MASTVVGGPTGFTPEGHHIDLSHRLATGLTPVPATLYPLCLADWDASRGIPDRAGMEVGHPLPLQCV